MPKPKYTIGPLSVGNEENCELYTIRDAENSWIATTCFAETGDRVVGHTKKVHQITEAANAARLVLCWNLHDELLKALKACYEQAKLFNQDTDECWVDIRNICEAAIAKAEGR